MGLGDTHHISRVVINPLNSNIVYVGALGHNTGPNQDRGVFMTTDGGETWKKVLYIDPEHELRGSRHGRQQSEHSLCHDVAIRPQAVALYFRQ